MKSKIIITLALVLIAWIGYRGYRIATSRSHSPTETIDISYENLDISVTYGRPYKKNRQIFGEAVERWWMPKGKPWTFGLRILTGLPPTAGALVPNGEYWRLGANDATEITFNKNVNFAGEPVAAGRYRMYAVPNADSWQVSLNSELGKFGYDEPDYSLDVVKVKVPVEIAPSETEQFTITFENDTSHVKMNLLWDKTLVRVPITTQEIDL